MRKILTILFLFLLLTPYLLFAEKTPLFKYRGGGFTYHYFANVVNEDDTDPTFGKNGFGGMFQLGKRVSNHWGFDFRGQYRVHTRSVVKSGEKVVGHIGIITLDSLFHFLGPDKVADPYWFLGLGPLISNICCGIYTETGFGAHFRLKEPLHLYAEGGLAIVGVTDFTLGGEFLTNVGLLWRW